MPKNMAGLTPKQQALLSRKGGGKGAAVAPVAVKQQGGGGAGAANPVSFLNEWCQKNGQSLNFRDAGQDASGNFISECAVDNQEVASASARNKKQAKTDCAAAAVSALGLG